MQRPARNVQHAACTRGVVCPRPAHLQLQLPSPDEATADNSDEMKKWFDKAIGFGGNHVWDGAHATPGLKIKARELYDGIVKAAHDLLQEEMKSMNELWEAMAGQSTRRGETCFGVEIRCLELVTARPGADSDPQLVHEDALSLEWLQCPVCATEGERPSATVSSVLSWS
jgi:hypothetical protein